jgi:hypothetical protein
MGSGAGTCGCAVTGAVRSLAANGTDVFVGTDATDIGGILQADHVVRWNGSTWHPTGSNTGGANGWFPASASIDGLATAGSNVFATGSFQNANGDPRADNVAYFDGTAWHPVGSDGAGNGPLNAAGSALAVLGTPSRLYAGGSFTSAGGDNRAWSAASFSLSQLIAVPTPTVTPGPSAVATPTVTPGPAAVPTPTVTPSPAPADTKAPKTSLRKASIDQAKRRATFKFGSTEAGSRFLCKLDKKKFKPCTSPKAYTKLKRGKHIFRVKARDRAGNVDATPTVKRFKIKR